MHTTVFTRSCFVLLLCVFTCTCSLSAAVAMAHLAISYTFTVTTTNDTHDAHPGDGKCADQHGRCSLRAAIEEADALPSGSQITISVPSGAYGLMLGTLNLTANTIIINGASRKTTLVDGNKQFTVMAVSPSVSVSLSRLSIENGYGNGGGIYNRGKLAVSTSTFTDNSVVYDDAGGGIFNDHGTLTVNTSIFTGNSASAGAGIENFFGALSVSKSSFSHNTAVAPEEDGGAIESYGYPATLTVSQSIFSHNSANGGDGGVIRSVYGRLTLSASTFDSNAANRGGVIFDSSSAIEVSGSTFDSNTASSDGGAIYNNIGGVDLSLSTFSGNTASSDGGAIYNFAGKLAASASTFSGNAASTGGSIDNTAGGTATLTTTIVANSPQGGNCSGRITDDGYNLDSGTSCWFHLKTDLSHTDPLLGSLGDHGGPTPTMPLRQGSPAIDWVPVGHCTPTDQRGQPRPDNGENVCDIGAYENILNL